MERVESDTYHKNVFVIDSPEQVHSIRPLSKIFTHKLLQILNSKIEKRTHNSWWSTRALRQLTYHKRAEPIERILEPLVKLGIIQKVKVGALPVKTVSRSNLHGILPKTMIKDTRQNHIQGLWCYKLLVESIVLVFEENGNRELIIPLEGMHSQNLEPLNYILTARTFILLQSLAKTGKPMDNTKLLNYINSNVKKTKQVDLTHLFRLSKLPFTHNLTKNLVSNISAKDGEFLLVNRVAAQRSDGIPVVHYEIKYDRIHFEMTNYQGQSFTKQNLDISLFHPSIEGSIVQTSDSSLITKIMDEGIVINIE